MIALAILSLATLAFPSAIVAVTSALPGAAPSPEPHRPGRALALMAATRTATTAAMARTAIVGRLSNGEVRHHPRRLWDMPFRTRQGGAD